MAGLFKEFVDGRIAADRMVAQDMAARARAVAQGTNEIRDMVVGEQARLTTASEERVADSQAPMSGVAGAGMLLGLARFISGAIARPITAMTGAMGRLADRDWSVEVPSRNQSDEIGAMARGAAVQGKRHRERAAAGRGTPAP